MGYLRGNIDEVPGPSDNMMFQFLAVPHAGFPTQEVDGRFVSLMLVCLCPPARRNGHDRQMDPWRAHRLRRNPGCVSERLFADEFQPSANDAAGGPAVVIGQLQ